jgi:hypothetical protein
MAIIRDNDLKVALAKLKGHRDTNVVNAIEAAINSADKALTTANSALADASKAKSDVLAAVKNLGA